MVEHHLAKVGVAGSNPVVRSRGTRCQTVRPDRVPPSELSACRTRAAPCRAASASAISLSAPTEARGVVVLDHPGAHVAEPERYENRVRLRPPRPSSRPCGAADRTGIPPDRRRRAPGRIEQGARACLISRGKNPRSLSPRLRLQGSSRSIPTLRSSGRTSDVACGRRSALRQGPLLRVVRRRAPCSPGPYDPLTSRHAPQCEQREIADAMLLKALLKVQPGSGGEYHWVTYGASTRRGPSRTTPRRARETR